MRPESRARTVDGVNLSPHVVMSALDARHDDLVRQARAAPPVENEGGPMRRLSRTRLALGGLVVAAAAVALTAVVAQASNQHEHPSMTQALRAASAKYHDISVAEGAGYSLLRDAQNIACIDNQPVGGMGVHFVSGGVGDTELDPLNPEALVYAPTRDRTLKLAALEYIVFAAAWDAEHSSPPSLFGQQFFLTPAPNRFGIPAFYALHVWIWQRNPAGLTQPWNPRVHC
jgi:hypothetical protein